MLCNTLNILSLQDEINSNESQYGKQENTNAPTGMQTANRYVKIMRF